MLNAYYDCKCGHWIADHRIGVLDCLWCECDAAEEATK